MKKASILLAIAALIVLMLGWLDRPAQGDDSMFVFVENSGWSGYEVCYDKQTGVMYAVSSGRHNSGTFTVLLDANGMPKNYEGFGD